jgi:hypothetical protein
MKSSSCYIKNVASIPARQARRGFVALFFGATLLWSGCSSPVNQSVSFDEADYKPYEAPGTAVIRGHAFVRSDTGMKHGAAGLIIYLVPLTAYTEERAKIMESGKEPVPADSRLDQYIKTTVGDVGGGTFQFRNLPAGKYLIYCKIDWEAKLVQSRIRDASGDFYALARTQVSNGELKNVVVTNLARK